MDTAADFHLHLMRKDRTSLMRHRTSLMRPASILSGRFQNIYADLNAQHHNTLARD
jgi:hypothetical protein